MTGDHDRHDMNELPSYGTWIKDKKTVKRPTTRQLFLDLWVRADRTTGFGKMIPYGRSWSAAFKWARSNGFIRCSNIGFVVGTSKASIRDMVWYLTDRGTTAALDAHDRIQDWRAENSELLARWKAEVYDPWLAREKEEAQRPEDDR